MKAVKRVVIGVALSALLCIAMYYALFKTLELPPSAAAFGGTNGGSAALVLRWCRPETLKPGMIIVAQTLEQPQPRLCRIEQIQEPDPSERPRAGRRAAQAILDMDFRPRYLVTPLNAEPIPRAELIYESQIKRQVVHVFQRE